MLKEAKNRGSVPECICFDSWYASLENLKAVRSYGWKWVTRLAANRLVSKVNVQVVMDCIWIHLRIIFERE